MLRCVRSAALAALAALAAPSVAGAQWRVHLDAHVSRPLASPQLDEFSYGGGGGAALEWLAHPRIGLLLRAQALALGAYDGALPEGVQHPGTSAFYALGLGVRAVPVPWHSIGDGVWFEVTGGAGLTGAIARPMVQARAGIAWSVGALALGPYVGYLRVFEAGTSVLPGDAQIALVGIEAMYSFLPDSAPSPERDARARAVAPPAPAPRVCPDAPHVLASDLDHDGCPDADTDGDTIADMLDRCPRVAEDRDGFEDRDGCLDADNDEDGFQDPVDRCPNEPETVNGVDDDDGCPDRAPVQVVQGRIRADTIQFGVNSAHVLPASFPTLQAIAAVLRVHPEYRTVFIEGHADETGDDHYNFNLSYQRALSVVDLLVEYGIERRRLTAMGFGRSSPLVPGHTPEARAQNRRVEFIVNNHRSIGRARTAQGYVDVHPDAPVTP